MALGRLEALASGRRRVRCVLLDALGTLVALEPPWPALARELRERHGVELTLEQAERALRAEIAFYRHHHHEGRDAASLSALRQRCAQTLRAALPPGAAALELRALRDALLASLSFRAYPDALEALPLLRARGLRLVVASNWDVSLHEVLERTRLRALLDGVVTSAEAGMPKPAPAVFEAALGLGGVGAAEALHVGDSPEIDIAGARALGIAVALIDRGDGIERGNARASPAPGAPPMAPVPADVPRPRAPVPDDVPRIASLSELLTAAP